MVKGIDPRAREKFAAELACSKQERAMTGGSDRLFGTSGVQGQRFSHTRNRRAELAYITRSSGALTICHPLDRLPFCAARETFNPLRQVQVAYPTTLMFRRPRQTEPEY
ncbi:hypothetical protein GX51_06471 [Blastomyces parvus]|uniref:Uncharacterized protein n=1 Tax=Blastomyces parvus TaxID=2060905 RepID=A0A2B7WQY2_9EURO|nr:hypothetical protein GX51_06471 [Blastomyces parvus]